MRLYRAELYKLCHKKAFLICSVLTMFTMLFYFGLMVNGEMTTVNGVTYRGYEAVRMDRQITEAYRGGLTDEKVNDIVEEYGLLSEAQDIRLLLTSALLIMSISVVFAQEEQTGMRALAFTTDVG